MTQQDKRGHEIKPGDHVYTKIRGGHREGEVEQVVETQQEAKEADVKNPPKVLYLNLAFSITLSIHRFFHHFINPSFFYSTTLFSFQSVVG